MANVDVGWKQVRGRKQRQKEEKITSFFVSGLPRNIIVEELRREFARFGEVADVYAAGRKDASGKFFAFVRFMNVTIEENLERRLQGLKYRNFPLNVNIARFERKAKERGELGTTNLHNKAHRPDSHLATKQQWNSRTREGRTFADAVMGNVDRASQKSITLKMDTEMRNWLHGSILIGEAHSLDHLSTFHIYRTLGVTTKYLGGLHLALEFGHSVDCTEYLNDKVQWAEWFKWLRIGSDEELRYERLAWLKIIGLPIHLWDADNFSRIAGNFGKVICPFEDIINRKDLSMGKVGILTPRRQWINEEIMVDGGGKMYKLGVVEYTDDWSPFKECPYDNTVDSEEEGEDEEDEDDMSDGVSDTWKEDRMEEDREEGEFIPDVPIMGAVPSTGEENDPADALGNIGNCEDGIRRVAPKSAYDSVTGEVGVAEVEESGLPLNDPRTDDVDCDTRRNPTDGGASVGQDEARPTLEKTGNGAFELGRIDKFCGLENLIPRGCFGPFPSRADCTKQIGDNNVPSLSNSNSNSKSEASKSTEGRVKRRRVRSGDPSLPPTQNENRDTECSLENSFDLNVNPQVPSCPCPNEDSLDSGSSCESSGREIRATIEVGKEIGVRFEDVNEEIGQMLAMGERNTV
ncbi:hypothetical protein L1887_14303 [Cichorium endivia]|nr:hypothetical protein L1887_14303 [Cichorium endivia]